MLFRNCVVCSVVLLLALPWAQAARDSAPFSLAPFPSFMMKDFFQIQKLSEIVRKDPHVSEAFSIASNIILKLVGLAENIKEYLVLSDDQITEITKRWSDSLSQPLEELIALVLKGNNREDSKKQLEELKNLLEKYRIFVQKILSNFLHRLEINDF
ncbi:uncharacterized protein LOC108740671 [Agrilus planipennis]|uniref:Uncharacterized protein LOC108740671 n=1 Tax=Agrilus planipennis TaxID=224129 RepID=A0A1W4X3B1_AGRPL|nr:uncharacterized protein LOC108740671 [Agrilus planipennis]